MENNKWNKISAVLAIALIVTISYSLWKKHQIEKELLNEFVVNVGQYAFYALPIIEEFEETGDQAAFADNMKDYHFSLLGATQSYSFGTIGDIAPDVENYNEKLVDPLYSEMTSIMKNMQSGSINTSEMNRLMEIKEILRDHQVFVKTNEEHSISEMKRQLDAEVEALN